MEILSKILLGIELYEAFMKKNALLDMYNKYLTWDKDAAAII